MSVTAVKNELDVALQTEIVGGELYTFYSLGQHIVVAPGVCGGRPTIKYTRLDARHIVAMIRSGEDPTTIAGRHQVPEEAIAEAISLDKIYDYEASYA